MGLVCLVETHDRPGDMFVVHNFPEDGTKGYKSGNGDGNTVCLE